MCYTSVYSCMLSMCILYTYVYHILVNNMLISYIYLWHILVGFDRFPGESGPRPKSGGQGREYPGQNRETDRCWCITDWLNL